MDKKIVLTVIPTTLKGINSVEESLKHNTCNNLSIGDPCATAEALAARGRLHYGSARDDTLTYMKILKECNLSEVIAELLAGRTIIFPTETSYGLGCDAVNQQAVDRVFNIKERVGDKPLLVVVPTVEMAKKYIIWNETIDLLANKYWPGPLTIVGKCKPDCGLAVGVVSNQGTVAVRVTVNGIVKFLSESLGKPIVATSGNISGAGDIYNAADAEAMFFGKPNQPDIILDFGQLPKNLPTTLVDASDNTIKILRQGELVISI